MEKNEIKNYLEKLSVDELWENLTYEQRQGIHDKMFAECVREDVFSQCETLEIKMNDEHANKVAKRYVYDGDYDNNVAYWDNLTRLIKEERENG